MKRGQRPSFTTKRGVDGDSSRPMIRQTYKEIADAPLTEASSFMKKAAEAALTIPTREGMIQIMREFVDAPDSQLSQDLRDKCRRAVSTRSEG